MGYGEYTMLENEEMEVSMDDLSLPKTKVTKSKPPKVPKSREEFLQLVHDCHMKYTQKGHDYMFFGLASPGKFKTGWRIRRGQSEVDNKIGEIFLELGRVVSDWIEFKTGESFFWSQIFQNFANETNWIQHDGVILSNPHVDINPGRVALVYGNLHSESEGGLWVENRGIIETHGKIIVGPFHRIKHAKTISGSNRLVLVLRLGSKFDVEECPNELYEEARVFSNLPNNQVELNPYFDKWNICNEIVELKWFPNDFLHESRKNSKVRSTHQFLI